MTGLKSSRLKTVDFLVTAVKNLVAILICTETAALALVIVIEAVKSKGVIKLIAFPCLFSQNLASVLRYDFTLKSLCSKDMTNGQKIGGRHNQDLTWTKPRSRGPGIRLGRGGVVSHRPGLSLTIVVTFTTASSTLVSPIHLPCDTFNLIVKD